MNRPNEIDIFLEEFEQESGLMTASRLQQHAQNIVGAIPHNKDAYDRGRTDEALKIIQALALVSIAYDLERIVKNGLNVDTTR